MARSEMTREEFKRAFSSKTVAYQPRFRNDYRPVVVEVPSSAHTPAGHALLCALINQLARAHQRIVLVGDLNHRLLCRDVFGQGTLMAATAGLAEEINPFIAIDVLERAPRTPASASLSVGPGGAGLQLGSRGWQAMMGSEATLGQDEREPWGAMLAACLGAWHAFQCQAGQRTAPVGRLSLWNFGRPGTEGPCEVAPIDVGRVLQVGVGGVGAALGYWLGLIGTAGSWTLVDGDVVEVSNLNRQLLFTAADAGYPDGNGCNKAERAADRLGLGAIASPYWYGTNAAIVEGTYDVVLALANERGIRGALQARQPPVLLHATTSANFQAQLHRHIGGRDDCIRCRLQGPPPELSCSEVSLDATGESDAALPFLSATAGLMLAAALARLATGMLIESRRNLAAVDFGGMSPQIQLLQSKCRLGCRSWGDFHVRRAIAAGTRYAALVQA